MSRGAFFFGLQVLEIRRSGRIADVIAEMRDVPARIVPYAASTALTRSAVVARRRIVDDMPRAFDRPTPYTLNSLYTEAATVQTMQARVAVKSRAGNSAVPSENFIFPEVFGGARREKRFERALRYAGVLARGHYAVTARQSELMDTFGNTAAKRIVQLLAYFQAFTEQGYRANMGAKGKARLAKRGRTKAGSRTIGGVEYFASHGPGERNGRRQHLAPGIYRRRGVHGSDIAPVLVFVRRPPTYRPRLDFDGLARQAADQTFPAEFTKALQTMLARRGDR